MAPRFRKLFASLDLEERILNGAALVAIVSTFFPWLSGEWLGGDTVTYSGFSFYTSFIGTIVFLILLSILLITAVPLLGGPIILKRQYKETVRVLLALQATVLLLASLSVLVKVTYEFSRIEIRFGIYLELIGSIVVLIYAFLNWQQYRRLENHEHFRHPEDAMPPSERQESVVPPPPPPPPPPPLKPEEHRHLRP